MAVQLNAAREAKKRWRYISVIVEVSSARAAVTRGPACRKLKNLHC
jgi:hypothetical protein